MKARIIVAKATAQKFTNNMREWPEGIYMRVTASGVAKIVVRLGHDTVLRILHDGTLENVAAFVHTSDIYERLPTGTTLEITT